MDTNIEFENFYDEFRERYPFVSISKKDAREYYNNMHGKLVRVDMLLDYILANGLEEDIEL
jgi:hypothetical protein